MIMKNPAMPCVRCLEPALAGGNSSDYGVLATQAYHLAFGWRIPV